MCLITVFTVHGGLAYRVMSFVVIVLTVVLGSQVVVLITSKTTLIQCVTFFVISSHLTIEICTNLSSQ